MIYLDNAATTKVKKEVSQVIYDSLLKDFANPASLYKAGMQSEIKINNARKTIAYSLKCKPEEIIFTSNASESNNIAIYGLALAKTNWADNIVTTDYEHVAVSKPLQFITKFGFTVNSVKPREDGNISLDDIVDLVNKKTALVSIIHVNNETGAIIDIKSLCKKIKQKNRRTAIHIDITQSFMKYNINISELNIETLAFSGHKIGAPKGIGGLYVKKGINITPIFLGGGQERGLRAGTENIHYILGIAKAVEIQYPQINSHMEHYKKLKKYLLEQLLQFENVVINSPSDAAPYTVNISFLNYKSETILHYLDNLDICISSGSACSKGHLSHSLIAAGLNKKRIDSAIRISFNEDSTTKDIDSLINALNNQEIQKVEQ